MSLAFLDYVMTFVTNSFALDTAGWLVLIAFAGAGYTLLAVMLGDHGPALLGAPVLVCGTAFGNRALSELGVQLAGDKLMNMAVGMAASMLLSAVLLVLILWSWSASLAR